MKKLYWRPHRMSARVIFLLATFALVGLVLVESFRVQVRQQYYREKLQAAKLTLKAFQIIKEERLKRGIPIDAKTDPARSGLIGSLISPITTVTGQLPAKQMSINPNFAAVIVHLLKRCEISPGDIVALGTSGSFPALNIAALAAVKVLKAKAVVISSVSSSQWGSNHPQFAWPDMERILVRRGILPTRSIAVSLGGIDDLAIGLNESGRQLLEAVIARSKLPKLDVENFEDSLKKRMTLYRQYSGGEDIKAYINIGGGTTSVGTRVGKQLFKAGLNRWIPRGASAIDSVMTRFAKIGVPVIHITRISELAQRYGLPLDSKSIPTVGEGKIFVREEYSLWLTGGVLLVIFVLMVGLLRFDLAHRLFSSTMGPAEDKNPEQMV
ncbi:MAG: poly-gamma-glutamate system protein [Pseudomonadota bacterium]